MKRPLYGSEAELRAWINQSAEQLRNLRNRLDENSVFKSGFHAEIALIVYAKGIETPDVQYYSLKDEGCYLSQVITPSFLDH